MGIKIAEDDDAVFGMLGVAVAVFLYSRYGHGWKKFSEDFLEAEVFFFGYVIPGVGCFCGDQGILLCRIDSRWLYHLVSFSGVV